jgi:hypothetical protein
MYPQGRTVVGLADYLLRPLRIGGARPPPRMKESFPLRYAPKQRPRVVDSEWSVGACPTCKSNDPIDLASMVKEARRAVTIQPVPGPGWTKSLME